MNKGYQSKKIHIKHNEKKMEDDIFFTKEEIRRLDKFHSETKGKFSDDEVYELMLKYKNDDVLILNELNMRLKEIKKGFEFEWQEIGKSK